MNPVVGQIPSDLARRWDNQSLIRRPHRSRAARLAQTIRVTRARRLPDAASRARELTTNRGRTAARPETLPDSQTGRGQSSRKSWNPFPAPLEPTRRMVEFERRHAAYHRSLHH